jgi:ubiquinone/menaquinone biosynthesis C-methylase UbiE
MHVRYVAERSLSLAVEQEGEWADRILTYDSLGTVMEEAGDVGVQGASEITAKPAADVDAALAGLVLYGDDFTGRQLDEWFADEEQGYFSLYGDKTSGPNQYGATVLAEQHSYRWLSLESGFDVLGVGCADGAELAPIVGRARSITVLEPAEGFFRDNIGERPATYLKPRASGLMPFQDSSFDLVVCFSALHHIPNVSTVVQEMSRVLRPGGHALLREPIVSMGDWRKPRIGLTKRERGIPLPVFRSIVGQAGFRIERETLCIFSAASRVERLTGLRLWISPAVVKLDRFICALPWWSRRYHTQTLWDRLRPTAVSLVLQKVSAPLPPPATATTSR